MPTSSFWGRLNGSPAKSASTMARYGTRFEQKKRLGTRESFHRDDRNFDFNSVRGLADFHYFPAIQDAEEFGGKWLPFGVDTSIFRPKPVEVIHDAAFLGTMYQKRAEYVGRIGYPLVRMQSVSSPNVRTSFDLLADAYCSTKIFVNLPALSRLLVTKVTEVMACGTFLLTPRLDHHSAYRNMEPFEHGKHLVYYNPDDPEEIARLVNYYLANPIGARRHSRRWSRRSGSKLPDASASDEKYWTTRKAARTPTSDDPWEAAISKLAKG